MRILKFPKYKTQAEIVHESVRRYAMEFLMKDDPVFTEEEAKVMVDKLVGFGHGVEQDMNLNQPLTYDKIWSYKEKAFPKRWPGPWRWIALLAVAIILCIIEYCT